MRRLLLWIAFLLPVFAVQAQSNTCDAIGVVTRHSYFSRTVEQGMFYSVYTPPCYDDTAEPYPVIYLMHGSNEDDGHWTRLGLPQTLDERIRIGEIPPVVVVMPFGNVIANRNRFDTFSWAHIFRNELMPDVSSQYHISEERARRAIGGISRGGFWAYQIAFTYPELFAVVGGHSAFFDLYHAEPADNPLDLALNAPEVDTMRLWLDRGIDDFADEGLDIMYERLTQRDLDVTYVINPQGEHNNLYWSAHIDAYIDFYVADWLMSSEPTRTPMPALSAFATNTPIAPIPTLPPPSSQANTPLLVPAVAFASTQTDISLEQVQAIAEGVWDDRLILTPDVAQQITPHPDTLIVELSALLNRLSQDRTRYTLLPLEGLTLSYRVLLVDGQSALTHGDWYPFTGDDSTLTRFTFSGVTALARNTRIALDQNGVTWATEVIQPYVTASDYFHMSSEVSFVPTCPQSNQPLLGGNSSFCANPDHFELFNQLAVDVVELTGNHNNDYGYQAYRDTFAWFTANDIGTVGGGETVQQARQPYQITHNGNRIALVACNLAGPYYALVSEDETSLGGVRPGATACDWDWLEQTLPALASEHDVLIVSVQYVEVEDYLPLESQQIDFRRIANLGADVIFGSQAHKPQTFEFYPTRRGETAFIHYGLGNFYFDQPFWGNQRFFLDTLYIADGQLRAIELFPGIIDDLARPRLMTADERLNFMFFMLVEKNGL
ncbi:MAG: CapA family protein [Anaerolineae bacterium]